MRSNFKRGGLLLLMSLSLAVSAFAQTQSNKERASEEALRALRSRDIPEASLSSTTDEAEWWKEVRAASKAIRPTRAAKKEREEFIRLIRKGLEKSFQIPIPDRYPIVLWRSPPEYTEEARNRRIRGSVALAVELLPDGSVGEVKIVQGLDPGLDEMVVAAARKLIFLPMVKDRKFVTSWMPMTMSFSVD